MKADACAKTSLPTFAINAFVRFRPDGVTGADLMEMVLAWGFFTGAKRLIPPWQRKLFDMASTGNRSAAQVLVDWAIMASWLVVSLQSKQPQMMREIARKQVAWPIVGTTQPGWEKDTLAQLIEMGLGQDQHQVDIRFRKAMGADANYPARRWAKAAVHCVSKTRILQIALASCEKNAVGNLWSGCWKRGEAPSWAAKAKGLPDLSKKSLPKWNEVIREMIRQQMPDFHLRPEWENQRNSCKARGRDTKGEIQNAILDDIVSALRTVAPCERGCVC